MKKSVLALIVMLISLSGYGQMVWHHNFQVAQALAIEKDQLILLDFWASWCGPCKTMDRQLWGKPEVVELSKNFVAYKVDVDRNRDLAMKYNATTIPKVVLVTATGEKVWEETGFGSSTPYIRMMESLPSNLSGLNKVLFDEKDKESAESYMRIAQAYQKIGFTLKSDMAEDFLYLSDDYFKKVTKVSENEEEVLMADLNQLFNDALKGKYSKAIKKVDKLEIAADNEEAQEFSNFIKAFCFKCDGDEKNYLEAKKTVKKEVYLSQLEDAKQ